MGRVIGAACSGLVVVLVVVAGTVAGVLAAVTGAMTGTATASGACTVPADQDAARPGGLSAAQARNAATIVAVGKALHVSAYGQVIAIATALQESNLINQRTATDHDSLGLFQQRPSTGWGTPTQLTTPTYAAHAFYTHLLRVPDWQHLPLTDAAQAVQRSAYPNAYARHETRARIIVASLATVPAASCRPVPEPGPASGWVMPVAGATITSGYRTPDRPDHNGIDLAAPRGTPIRAVSAGVVTLARCDPATGACDRDGSLSVAGCGWYVEIGHPGPVTTRYCHLAHQPTVRAGQHVAAGQVIGAVGMSGNADGPHCHFEIHLGYPATPANATDPQKFLHAHRAHS